MYAWQCAAETVDAFRIDVGLFAAIGLYLQPNWPVQLRVCARAIGARRSAHRVV